MVTYCSTRGDVKGVSFEDVVLAGLASDRGLFVPEIIPTFSAGEIISLKDCCFEEIALAICSKFISTNEIPQADLRTIVYKSTSKFRDSDVTPVVKCGDYWVLELFHGPTFAFKDVALQFLGNLFEYFLKRKQGRKLTILGATSGDTGSAAIHGLRGKQGLSCFILYPLKRVSEVQEQQMITVQDENIHCLRVPGTFDDCQDMVKAAFMDAEFRDSVQLGAVNSINFARVLAQISYYFFAYFQVCRECGDGAPVNFSVPTGNFGDVLACYYAKSMGLPVGHLIVGTNENDILARFFTTGTYERQSVVPSISPSMDICVSSNFERYLYHSMERDAKSLQQLMQQFETNKPASKDDQVSNKQGWATKGKLTVEEVVLRRMRSGGFLAESATTQEALDTIRQTFHNENYLVCPHTACGIVAASKLGLLGSRTVCLATAHPAKFYDSVSRAVDTLPPLPEELEQLKLLPGRVQDIPLDLEACQRIISDKVNLKHESTRQGSFISNLVFPVVAAVAASWIICKHFKAL